MDNQPAGHIMSDNQGGYRVILGNHLTSPTFNSEGAAAAYLAQLRRGRKPEFSDGFGPNTIGEKVAP